eukprot:TRINITY_DN15023_c0_g1_i2.p1 TRINITY_DN15023_c0_g1~~TRINITY_DN15023_c0_g1_i2.p1  ORF type:complete len:311 (+),score=93.57 TRINITY_DN15023_c0_g1_i2:130-933(+)
MSAEEIGSVGCATLADYLKVSKGKRDQTIKALDLEFQNFKEMSLIEQTYTRGDVEQLLSNYFGLLRVSLNKQYQDYAEGTVDVALDILEQADGKEAKLDISLKRFEDASLDSDILKLEQALTSRQGGPLLPMVATKGVDPGKKLLEAQQETQRLKEKASSMQQHFTAMMREKTQVQNELNNELDILRAVKELGTAPSDAAIKQLKDEIETLEKGTAEAEAEAQGKINESAQFQNLKTIIQRKNEEIKKLRERLIEFEPDAKNDDDDE